MLVSDFVEALWTALHDDFNLYYDQFESQSYSCIDSLLTMCDRLTVESACLLEVARACCPEYPKLITACHVLNDDSLDLCYSIIKSRYKAFSRSSRR